METKPRMNLKRRVPWLIVVWSVCAFLPEIVFYLRSYYPKLRKLPLTALAVIIFAGAIRLTVRLMTVPEK
jgi:hypothetical protein